jgi:DHA1 family bicyclomycin/chloramphenicol resistance-like MFS transporter
VQSVISITFLIASINHLLGLYQIGMLFIFLACLGISQYRRANSSSIYKKTGSASALMGAIQLGLGAFASFAVGLL